MTPSPDQPLLLAAFLAGIGVGLLAGLAPDAIRGARLVRFYLKTRDRERAVALWLFDEAKRRQS